MNNAQSQKKKEKITPPPPPPPGVEINISNLLAHRASVI